MKPLPNPEHRAPAPPSSADAGVDRPRERPKEGVQEGAQDKSGHAAFPKLLLARWFAHFLGKSEPSQHRPALRSERQELPVQGGDKTEMVTLISVTAERPRGDTGEGHRLQAGQRGEITASRGLHPAVPRCPGKQLAAGQAPG